MSTPKKTAKSARPPMRLSDVYQAPGHLIRRSQQISVAIFHEEFEGYDVTPVQYAALIAIRDRPGTEQHALVNHLAIDRSTVGAMLKTLEQRDLIVRVTPKDNLRVKRLHITETGDQLLRTTRENIDRVQERILSPLNVKERKLFMQLLSGLVHINNKLSRAPLKVVGSSSAGRDRS